jgi:branched-chain amino acid transport system substrate-binding protein
MISLKRKIIFRTVVLIIMTCFITLTLIGCGADSNAQKEPLKIGLLVPYTGVFADNGYDITRGVELYLDEVEWKAGGREIKLIKEDSEMNGQVGLQKTRRLVESEKVDVLCGVVSSTVAYAISDYVVGNKLPFIITNAGASDLTRDKGSKYIFRVSFSNGQYEYPQGIYTYEEMGFRKVVVMAPDYAAGREKAIGFIDGFKAAGGEIVQEIYPKLGTSDYGPYLAQIKEADAVWAHFSGSDSLSFVKQYDEYGLKSKMPLLSSGDLVVENFLMSQADSALGIISSLHYSPELDIPENKKFVTDYKAKYGVKPSMYSDQGYITARVIVDAVNNLNGNTADTEKLLSAIREVQFVAPRGPFKFDPKTQNVIFDTYIRKVEKKDGEYVNTVIKTIPDVVDYRTPEK